MITAVYLPNPFQPKSRVIKTFSADEVSTLSDVADAIRAKDIGEFCINTVNGYKVEPDHLLKDGDFVVIAPNVLGGGGGGKNVAGIIAGIAIMAFTGGSGAGLLGGFLGSQNGMLALGLALYFGGSLLMGNQKTPIIDNPKIESAFEGGYGWSPDTIKVTAGAAIPETYGTVRASGQLIAKQVEPGMIDGKPTQYLNLLLSAGAGALDSISDILINDTAIESLENVESQIRLGTNNQDVVTIGGLSQVLEQQTFSSELANDTAGETWVTKTTTEPGERVRLDICLQSGAYAVDTSSGANVDVVLYLKGHYREVGEDEWIPLFGDEVGKSLGKFNSRRPVYISEFFTPPDTTKCYEIRLQNRTLWYYNEIYAYGWAEMPANFQVAMTWCAVTVISDSANQSFPGIALVALKIPASQGLSGSMPKVSWAQTRENVLVWNPTEEEYQSKPANNIAWMIYDLIHNCRRIYNTQTSAYEYAVFGEPKENLNFTEFSAWAAYLAEESGDAARGLGNLLVDTADQLWPTIQKLAVSGRAFILQQAGVFKPVWDAPKAMTQIFTAGNIIAGSMTGAFLPERERASAIEASFFDEGNGFNRETLFVTSEDYNPAGLENPTQVFFPGLTDSKIVYRLCKHILRKNKLLRRTISLQADIDSIVAEIGDVIGVQSDITQWGVGGRIMGATMTSIVIDQAVTLEPGEFYALLIRHPNDTLERRNVDAVEVLTTTTNLKFTGDPWSEAPTIYSLYSFGVSQAEVKPFLITGIRRNNDLQATISAIEYVTAVYYDDVDFPVIDYTSVNAGISSLTVRADDDTGKLGIAWTLPPNRDYSGAIVYINGKPQGFFTTEQDHVEIDATPGGYVVRVVPIDGSGREGDAEESDEVTLGNPVLSSVSGISLDSEVEQQVTGLNMVFVTGSFTIPILAQSVLVEIGEGEDPVSWTTVQESRLAEFRYGPVLPDTLYTLRFTAKNRYATAEAVSDTVTTEGDSEAPGAPEIAVTTLLKNIVVGIALSSAPNDLAGFEIYRHTSDNSAAALLRGSVSSKNGMAKYPETADAYGDTYYYWAKAFDVWGNKSDFSSVAGPITISKIVGADILAGALDRSDMFAEQVVEALAIKDAAITAAKLDTNAVTNTKIAAEAVTAAKIAAAAVEEAKLAAAAVTEAKIATNAVSELKIASSAVTEAKIAASAVSNGKLATSAVTETKIANDAVTSPKIVAEAVLATKMTVVARELVNPVSITGHVKGWGGIQEDGSGSSSVTSYDSGENALKITSSGNGPSRCQSFRLDHNKIYRITGQVKKSAASGQYYLGLISDTAFFAAADSSASGSIDFSRWTITREASSDTNNFYFVSSAAGSSPTSYEDFTFYLIGANRSINDVPNHVAPATYAVLFPYAKADPTCLWCGIRVLNWNNTEQTHLYLKNLSVTEVGTGQIVTDNLVANCVTSGKITTGELITLAAQIKDGIIGDAKIANLDAGKINAGTLAAERIAVGSLAANKISGTALVVGGAAGDVNSGATTVNGGKITAESVAATQLAANAVTAIKINADAVTAEKIAAGAITTLKLDVAALKAPVGAFCNFTAKGVTTTSIAKDNGVIDVTGNANHAKAFTGVTVIDGALGKCFGFDGTDNQRIERSSNGGSSALSLCVWVRPTTDGTIKGIISTYTHSPGYRGISIAWHSSGTLRLYWGTGSAQGYADISGVSVATNEWHHVSITRNATTTKVYFDAIERYSNEDTVSLSSSDPLVIGKWSSGYSGYAFVGQLFNPSAYNRELTVSEVKALYMLGVEPETGQMTADRIAANAVTAGAILAGSVTTSKLASAAVEADKIASGAITAEKINVTAISAPYGAALSLSVSGATTASIALTNGVKDTSGNARHATASGGVSVLELNRGRGLSFDGTNDYIYRSSGGTGSGNQTLSAWIYTRSVSGIQGYFGNVDNAGDRGFGLYSDGTSLKLWCGRDTVGGAGFEICTIAASAWYHVVVVRTSTTSFNVYVNGVKYTISLGLYPGSVNASAELSFGRVMVDETVRYSYCYMTAMKGWTRALSDAEAKSLYQLDFNNDTGTITADRVVTGQIKSLNYATDAGSMLDLDNGDIKMGGSSAPRFSFTNSTNSGVFAGFSFNATDLTAGSGSNAIGVSTDAGKRAFWAGSETPSSAPFRVTHAGAMTTTSGQISGITIASDNLNVGGTVSSGWSYSMRLTASGSTSKMGAFNTITWTGPNTASADVYLTYAGLVAERDSTAGTSDEVYALVQPTTGTSSSAAPFVATMYSSSRYGFSTNGKIRGVIEDISDADIKKDFSAFDSLEKLRTLNVSRFKFDDDAMRAIKYEKDVERAILEGKPIPIRKQEEPELPDYKGEETEHAGFKAGDFNSIFGLSNGSTSGYRVGDAIGVALRAIQELAEIVERQAQEIENLKQTIRDTETTEEEK